MANRTFGNLALESTVEFARPAVVGGGAGQGGKGDQV